MLHLEFRHFRCWNDLDLDIPLGHITLIKGDSGSGKTTIFQGIVWCLYGNIRLVAPNYSDSKVKTRVTISIPYTLNDKPGTLIITRQKNPGRLVLVHIDETHEDKVAQAIIDDIFGTYDVWLASCYIGQGCRNSFLNATNIGKMDLLNTIAFHEDDPTTYIERIDTETTQINTQYTQKLALFTQRLDILQKLIPSVDFTKSLTSDQITAYQVQIQHLTQQRNTLEANKIQRNIDLTVLNNLKRDLYQLTTQTFSAPTLDSNILSKYGANCESDLTTIETCIKQIVQYLPMLQRRDDLQNEVSRIKTQLNMNPNDTQYTMQDYQETLAKETLFMENKRLSQNLGADYSVSGIQDKILLYKTVLAGQDRLKLERDFELCNARLTQLEHTSIAIIQDVPLFTPVCIPNPEYIDPSVNDTLSQTIAELSKEHGACRMHIEHLVASRDIMACPKCDAGLRYQGGKLISAEMSPINADDIMVAQNKLAHINNEVLRINKQIMLNNQENNNKRQAYENAMSAERLREAAHKDICTKISLENQKREFANKTRQEAITECQNQRDNFITNLNATVPYTGSNRRILTTNEIEQSHIIIGKLSSIVCVPEPNVTSAHIRECLKHQEIKTQYETAIIALQTHMHTIPTLYHMITVANMRQDAEKLQNYCNLMRSHTMKITQCEQMKQQLEEKIIVCEMTIGPDTTPEITRITSEIEILHKGIESGMQTNNAIQFKDAVTKEREELVQINTTLSDLGIFRQHAVETECLVLQHMVDSINACMHDVCSTLFAKEIDISLQLFKTMKTTKNTKPVINFQIAYQGGSFDNINQLSGGEGDRASLALTLALNKLSGCPILMFDESLASLDINMKEAAVRAMHASTNNTVIVVMHDGIEGIFDNVINIDEIRERMPLA